MLRPVLMSPSFQDVYSYNMEQAREGHSCSNIVTVIMKEKGKSAVQTGDELAQTESLRVEEVELVDDDVYRANAGIRDGMGDFVGDAVVDVDGLSEEEDPEAHVVGEDVNERVVADFDTLVNSFSLDELRISS